jgi:hypothetical protein
LRGPSPARGKRAGGAPIAGALSKNGRPQKFFPNFPNIRARRGYFRRRSAGVVHPSKALKAVAKIL